MAHDKKCVACGGTEFYKNGRCAPCERKKQAAYRVQNRDLQKQRSREWRLANPEKGKAATLRWRENNKARVKQTREAWVEKNRAKVAADTRRGWDKYQEQNAAKVKQSKASYRRRNPELFRLYKHNRRARESGGKLSVGIVDRLFAIQKGRCACCGAKLGDGYHLDHILPLALGGMNEDTNMQLLRAECNVRKSAKHPIDFMQSKGFLL